MTAKQILDIVLEFAGDNWGVGLFLGSKGKRQYHWSCKTCAHTVSSVPGWIW